VNRLLPASVTLAAVTALLYTYGSTRFAWLAGPVAALAVWALDRDAQEPALAAEREPQPID
jgi:hypothetical protein